MAKRPEWHDEYWLLLMQLYLKKPQGVKHLYSRGLIDVALELHIHPRYIHRKMYELRSIDTPRLQRLWDEYAKSPRKLARGIKLLRRMNGFGNADEFYAGVEVGEAWERDFKPLAIEGYMAKESQEQLTTVKLVMILNLYFRLTPLTMTAETPEVAELASLIRSKPQEVADVLEAFLQCDPFIGLPPKNPSPLLEPCRNVWKRFGNEDPEKLASLASQLREYFV